LTQAGGVDVLFFGDTSGSMTEELLTLSDEITVFLDRLDQNVKDWQLLAVTGPEGCGLHGVIDGQDLDPDRLFAEAITTPPGEDLVDEWGLYSATSALLQTGPGDCNEGFLRDSSLLHVIFVSDEDDNSPGWNQGDPEYWQAYLDTMIRIKGEADQVILSAVTGPNPEGCFGAEPGVGYNEAVAWTEGELLSICDDWSNEIGILADAGLLHQAEFILIDTPIESSIGVSVNGDSVPTGWIYEPDSQSVLFTDEAPVTGDHVRVTYYVRD